MERFAWLGIESNGRAQLGAWLVRALVASSALACGDGFVRDAEFSPGASTSSPLEDSRGAAAEGSAPDVLAELHIKHFTITFSSMAEGPEPEVSVAAGANCSLVLPCDRRDPVTELRALYEPRLGALTHLEMFRALAPGVRPPEALTASHALEAFDAGRDDDRVIDIAPLVPRMSGSEHSPFPIETIAELSVEGTTYRFQAAGSGPDAMVFVTESGVTEGLNALTRLAITQGDLTLLETFLALAPDAEPPLALVATHSREIERMGTRTDDTVRQGLALPAL
jgi:hypothetical protein